MKRTTIRIAVIATIAAAGLLYLIYAFTLPQARVIYSDGKVEVRGARDTHWREAHLNMRLKPGDEIRTGKTSEVEITLGRGARNIVKLNNEAKLRVSGVEPAVLDIYKGGAWLAAGKLKEESSFEVHTPTSVCGVRGTGWRIWTHCKETIIDGFEGKVTTHGVDANQELLKEEVIVAPGRRVIIKQYEEPATPVKLPDEELDKWDAWRSTLREHLAEAGIDRDIPGALRMDDHPAWQRGMCYVTWYADKYKSYSSNRSMKDMLDVGVDWVAITATWYQNNINSPKIFPAEMTPTDESLSYAIERAHKLGMRVLLKPHVDPIDARDDHWRGTIGLTDTFNWDEWFDNYETFIKHYAQLAEANDVEMFCVGTELISSVNLRPDLWRMRIIPNVRNFYNGPIVYAANWDNYTNIEFWDLLDYAGIDAYFPLSEEKSPPLEIIREGWSKWVDEIEEWQAEIDRPVIFPEIGYHSADWAARRPWSHQAEGDVNLKLQRDCYEALFEEFFDKDWFYGAYWWGWEAEASVGGEHDTGFTPQLKPALDIVREWYNKPDPRKSAD